MCKAIVQYISELTFNEKLAIWHNPKNGLETHENGIPKSEIPSGGTIPQMKHTSCSVHLCLYLAVMAGTQTMTMTGTRQRKEPYTEYEDKSQYMVYG